MIRSPAGSYTTTSLLPEVIAPNGAGKTSLIESISSVTLHSSGRMLLDGEPIDKLSRVTRARRGIVFIEQGRTVFPSLTVRENISQTARMLRRWMPRSSSSPSWRSASTRPRPCCREASSRWSCSRGAFAAKPRVLLIDEMPLGLAPVVFMRLMPIVKSIADSGVAVLLVEQFTQLALRLAREAVVVAGGRVSFQGTAAELKEHPELLHRAYRGG